VTWPLKERLSTDTWRVLQELESEFDHSPPANPEHRLGAQMNLLDRAIVTLSALAGLLSENTTRGYGWRFFEVGKRLERALQMADLLRSGLDLPAAEVEPYLATMLEIADSSITYRTRYFTALRTESVLKLLLSDEANPRSVNFQLATLLSHVHHLPGYKSGATDLLPLQLAEKALQTLRRIPLDDLVPLHGPTEFSGVGDSLLQLRGMLYDFSEALTARHFSLVTASRLTVSL
jgi:uncharacterized alpha-E superfamily protein